MVDDVLHFLYWLLTATLKSVHIFLQLGDIERRRVQIIDISYGKQYVFPAIV